MPPPRSTGIKYWKGAHLQLCTYVCQQCGPLMACGFGTGGGSSLTLGWGWLAVAAAVCYVVVGSGGPSHSDILLSVVLPAGWWRWAQHGLLQLQQQEQQAARQVV
jgi:hypothetical protein